MGGRLRASNYLLAQDKALPWTLETGDSADRSLSNARLRGASSKGSTKSPVSPISEDGHLNPPRGLSQRSKSSSNLSSKLPPPAATPSLSQTFGTASPGDEVLRSYRLPQPLPMWLNPSYAKHIVKGNFMTLSSRPKSVEQGEWMAHQGTHYSIAFISQQLTFDRSGGALSQSLELCPCCVCQRGKREEPLQCDHMPPNVCRTVRCPPDTI